MIKLIILILTICLNSTVISYGQGKPPENTTENTTTFCTMLNAIITSADNDGYKQVKGLLKDSNIVVEWYSKMVLPGAAYARVLNSVLIKTYTAYIDSSFSYNDKIKNEYRYYNNKIKSCLTNWNIYEDTIGFTVQFFQKSKTGSSIDVDDFDLGNAPAMVKLFIDFDKRKQEIFLNIKVLK